jgi:two-component system CheB/CheR fusion protein
MATRTDIDSFEQILAYLRQSRGFDFTAYKRTSLMRRVLRRMQTVDVATFDGYLDHLQVHPEEFGALFNTILINVTSFFRDPDVWSYLDTEIIPQLLDDRAPSDPLRVWSAGCASGQEAYSIAMLLAERLGMDGLRERTKIYATDVDEEALAEARRATYSERQLADLPPALAGKYFDIRDGTGTLNRDLRRAVIFGRVDLIQDATISRVDLLLCRNTLMYFNGDAQARILSRFSFSVNGRGLLVLGRAEMPFSRATMFDAVDLKRRVFRVVARATHRDRMAPLTQAGRDTMADASLPHARLRQAAFEAGSAPQIVLDASGVVVAVNARARLQFNLAASDIGKPLQDLEVSYRPADLRTAIDRVATDGHEVYLKDVRYFVNDQSRYFDLTIAPLFDDLRTRIGTRITFDDVTRYRLLQSELNASKQELDTAYEELQSTNEELETTNEELQSTVEELETTNEELQSTNEELETMNEELQSTNEELQTMNDEMRSRSTDLNSANAFLESVFASLRAAVVVLDREYRVQVWNAQAEELWGVRGGEAVGTHFLGLDIGLPVAELSQPIRDVLSGDKPHAALTIRATNRRGKTIDCGVTIAPLEAVGTSAKGVILLMEERDVPTASYG